MRNALDFSSWQALFSTLLGLAVFSLVVVGIRLLVMQVVQKRRERENRQINERLRTLIAAYKTLGGSFTGNLAVDPAHLRDLRARSAAGVNVEAGTESASAGRDQVPGSDRSRRVRDAVEASLSDVILLGTEEQVRLAVRAAAELTAGRRVETAELVVSLRTFIRQVLDLEPIPAELAIPKQGPVRPSSTGSKGGGRDDRSGRGEGAQRGGRDSSGGGGGGGGAGVGFGAGTRAFDHEGDSHHSDSGV